MKQLNRAHYAVMACALLALSACTGTRIAYQAAEHPVEKAAVIAEHYYAAVKQASDLKAAGAPAEVVSRLQAADRVAKPIVIELTRVAEAYQAVQSAENELALQEAMNDAAVALNAFINVIQSVRQ